MTGAEIVAKIRLQLDELEKTLQAEKPKKQAAENMIFDPCPSCGDELHYAADFAVCNVGRLLLTETQPTKNGGVYYRKVCPRCELQRDQNKGGA